MDGQPAGCSYAGRLRSHESIRCGQSQLRKQLIFILYRPGVITITT